MPRLGRADLHIHTTYSDGWPSPGAVIDHLVAAGDLDVIAITDHDSIEGALRAADHASRLRRAPHVIIGEEVSSRHGHILGLFMQKRVRPGMSAAATIHAIREQGGMAIAAHPFWRTDRSARGRSVHGVGWWAAELEFDAIEVENSTPGFYLFNQMARRLCDAVGGAELGKGRDQDFDFRVANRGGVQDQPSRRCRRATDHIQRQIEPSGEAL